MKKMTEKLLVSVFLFLFLASGTYAPASAMGRTSGVVHADAPDFRLESVGGKTVELKDLKGKGAILFFFTTWCPYCREKIPALSRDYGRFQNEGVTLMVINVGESERKVSSFAEKEHAAFDIFLDKDMKVSENYGVVGVPTFVLIDKDGKVAYEGNDLPHNYNKLLE